MESKNIKQYIFKVGGIGIFLMLNLLIMLVIGEITCRVFLGIEPFEKQVPHAPYDTAQKDEILGWKMTPNYTFSGIVKNSENEPYPVELKYDENGFKEYGNPNSNKKKVFFIGDSYTACIEVSNEKSFYNLIKDSLDIEVFAYGHAGFSTLQQFMVFEKYLPIIQPDLVVWQTCSNDFIDNYAPLEFESAYKVGERRPYIMANGNIEYYRPVTMMKTLAEYSSFMRFLDEKWQNVSYEYLEKDKKVAEHWIINKNRDYEPYAQSIKLTNIIFDKIKATLPEKTKLVGFSADIFEPQAGEFKNIFNKHGFEYSMKPAALVNEAKYFGKIVHSIDLYHWNERGHELIANGLIELIED